MKGNHNNSRLAFTALVFCISICSGHGTDQREQAAGSHWREVERMCDRIKSHGAGDETVWRFAIASLQDDRFTVAMGALLVLEEIARDDPRFGAPVKGILRAVAGKATNHNFSAGALLSYYRILKAPDISPRAPSEVPPHWPELLKTVADHLEAMLATGKAGEGARSFVAKQIESRWTYDKLQALPILCAAGRLGGEHAAWAKAVADAEAQRSKDRKHREFWGVVGEVVSALHTSSQQDSARGARPGDGQKG